MAPPHHSQALSFLHAAPYAPPDHGFLCNVSRETGHGPVYHCPHYSFDCPPCLCRTLRCRRSLQPQPALAQSIAAIALTNCHACDCFSLKNSWILLQMWKFCDFILNVQMWFMRFQNIQYQIYKLVKTVSVKERQRLIPHIHHLHHRHLQEYKLITPHIHNQDQ